MRRLSALLTALMLPTAQPLLLGAVTSTAVVVAQVPAQAQNTEAVAQIAEAITVRIEGATQGSGVLVRREGNRYTVLTAWHVVSGQRAGEELDVYTPDGQRHSVEPGSIQRLGQVDMAVLSFVSSGAYQLARVGDVSSVKSGGPIYVSGFPLPTSSVPSRIWRFLDGKVIANAKVAIPNGYQLLYSNPTLPGMSGGAVLNGQGQLVGIHGQGETDINLTEQQGVAVKTGTNQAVPTTYYNQLLSNSVVVSSSSQSRGADNYLAQAKVLLGLRGREKEVVRLSSQALAMQESAEAFLYRANAKAALGDNQGATSDYEKAILINPRYSAPRYRLRLHKSRKRFIQKQWDALPGY